MNDCGDGILGTLVDGACTENVGGDGVTVGCGSLGWTGMDGVGASKIGEREGKCSRASSPAVVGGVEVGDDD